MELRPFVRHTNCPSVHLEWYYLENIPIADWAICCLYWLKRTDCPRTRWQDTMDPITMECVCIIVCFLRSQVLPLLLFRASKRNISTQKKSRNGWFFSSYDSHCEHIRHASLSDDAIYSPLLHWVNKIAELTQWTSWIQFVHLTMHKKTKSSMISQYFAVFQLTFAKIVTNPLPFSASLPSSIWRRTNVPNSRAPLRQISPVAP